MDRLLAFRAYGEYRWPPLPVSTPGPATKVFGIVELHFVANSGGKLTGHLRWVPRTLDTTPQPWPQTPIPRLAELNDAALRLLLHDGTSAFTLELGRKNGPSAGRRLLFEGLRVLDQYEGLVDADGRPVAQPLLRLPMASVDDTVVRPSAIQIGRATPSDEIELSLLLPLPVAPNTTQLHAAAGPQAWFAINLIYPVAQAKLPEPPVPRFTTLTFGPRGLSESVAEPKTCVLGRFGIAPFFKGPSTVDDDQQTDSDDARVPKDHPFWADRAFVLSYVLERFGFPPNLIGSSGIVAACLAEQVKPALEGGELQCFPGLGVEPLSDEYGNQLDRGFRIRQRFAIGVEKSMPSGVRWGPGGRFRCVRKDLQLRIGEGDDVPWLSFGEWIHLEAELRGSLQNDKELWAANPAWDLEIRYQVGGYRPLTALQQSGSPLPEVPGGPRDTSSLEALLATTVAAMRLTLAGRRQLHADKPPSLLPELTGIDEGAEFGLFAEPARCGETAAFGAPLGEPGRHHHASLQPLGGALRDGAAHLDFWARWPGFAVGGAEGKAVRLSARHADAATARQDRTRPFVLSLVEQQDDEDLAEHLGVLDGMLFSWQHALLASGEPDISCLRIGLAPWGKTWPQPKAEQPSLLPVCAGDFDLKLVLCPLRFEPLNDDSGSADRRDPVLLWHPPPAPGQDSPWRVEVSESVRIGETQGPNGWRLAVAVSDRGADTGAGQATVMFASEPYSFLRYRAVPLSRRGSDGNALVAQYDSAEGGGWTTLRSAPWYHYQLPPQSVGESMDKPGRLEIHDLQAEDDGEEFHRPYPLNHGDVPRRRIVDFRLTPAADLWVRPSDVERNYLLPEWATRRLFTKSGQGGVGAALTAFRGEFVYGLAVGIDPQAETGPARSARVAELEALTGQLPAVSATLRAARWGRIHKAVQQRPERLEIWAADADRPQAFAPARFERGAAFALRTTALHRPALAGTEPAVSAEAPTQFRPNSPRLHAQGLPGGALWPIESLNVLNLLLDKPDSSSGHIESLGLSPIGGDADQTVRFCNDRITVITETRNGHVQRQRVEVIGRITVWWHRAKHVVVYERTVNPSAQFTPVGGIGSRTRRPVLRKVREFIELLQPERRYPDAAGATSTNNAFLQGLRFNSTVIPVDSLWGQDVDTRGWKVPLWNRHAARQRPQVYTMPDIAFLMASEGTDTDALSSQACLNPENLYFFTSTERNGTSLNRTADTDRWTPEVSLDWCNLPPPAPRALADEAASEDSVPTGFAQFTWRLGPATQRTAVNEGRGNRPVYAALKTLTFMRAARTALAPHFEMPQLAAPPLLMDQRWTPGQPLAGDNWQLQTLANAVQSFKLPGTLPTDNAVKQDVRYQVQSLLDAVTGLNAGDLKQHFDVLRTAKSAFDAKVSAHLGGGGLFGDAHAECTRWKQGLLASISAKRLLIQQQLQGLETAFAGDIRAWRADASTLPDWANSKADLTNHLAKLLDEAIQPALESVTVEIGKADRSCEAARQTVLDLSHEMATQLARCRGELDKIRSATDPAKPWSEQRLAQLRGQIDRVRADAAAAVDAAVLDARHRVAAEADAAAIALAGAADVALQQLARGLNPKTLWPATTEDANWPLNLFKQIKEKLDKAIAGVYQARTAIDSHKDDLDARDTGLRERLQNELDALTAQLQTARTALAGLTLNIDSLGTKVDRVLVDNKQQLSAALVNGASALAALSALVRDQLIDELAALGQKLSDLVAGSDLRPTADTLLAHVLAWEPKADEEYWLIFEILKWCDASLRRFFDDVDLRSQQLGADVEAAIGQLRQKLADASDPLKPDAMRKALADTLLGPLNGLLGSLSITLPPDSGAVQATADRLLDLLGSWRQGCDDMLAKPEQLATVLDSRLEEACKLLGSFNEQITQWAGGADAVLNHAIDEIKETDLYKQLQAIEDALADETTYLALVEAAQGFEKDVARIANGLNESGAAVGAYAEKAIGAIADIGKGDDLLAAPNKILRAMAAIGDAPALPNLDYARQRIGYYYGLVDDVVDTTPVQAYFGRLGESLKAWGLSLPFSKIGDRLLPDDLSKFDIGTVFRNCGGLQLEQLFKGCKLPEGTRDAIRLSHEFNKESMRAWVQLDVDAPLPGRQALLSLGPFTLNAVNTRLVGRVRLEASKDTERVEDQGEATLNTDFEAVVGGQVMVTLRQVAVRFSKGEGLKVDFDPKKVEINPSLQFVQNTLGSIFGDELGGLNVIKRNGIPVGLEHLFSMPPMSLMFGTSGVQNIQISNQFQLLAYPDFRIANRFSLARPELPFLFSVFIIGGTGWLTVDVDYRPFDKELMVVVDAAAGGSAALGFAFFGCTGAVAITLSAALTYRKLIGQSGGGLTVSMVVTVTGVVSVLSIASAQLSVPLRLSYAENGDIDARGEFRLKVRISRFFTVSAGGQARYQMTGGQRRTDSRARAANSSALDAVRKKASGLLKGQGGLHHV